MTVKLPQGTDRQASNNLQKTRVGFPERKQEAKYKSHQQQQIHERVSNSRGLVSSPVPSQSKKSLIVINPPLQNPESHVQWAPQQLQTKALQVGLSPASTPGLLDSCLVTRFRVISYIPLSHKNTKEGE